MNKQIVFIGAGNMAEALIKGIINSGISLAKNITATDTNADRLSWIQEEYSIQTNSSNTSAIQKADIIILAIKPQMFPEVLEEIVPVINSQQLIISIAAGITTAKIENIIGEDSKVIRVMPNTPALVQKGVTAITRGKSATEEDELIANKIFGSVGMILNVKEDMMDIITATSGSGPAYIFYFMEAMIEAAEENGLSKTDALNVVTKTVCGAGELVLLSHEPPKELRENVTSPGGTTQAALEVMEKNDFKKIIKEAVTAATSRSKELAR